MTLTGADMKKILLLLGIAVISILGLWLLRNDGTPESKPDVSTSQSATKKLPPAASPRPEFERTLPKKKVVESDLGHALNTVLSQKIGRDITTKTAETRIMGQWALTCGEPMEVGGEPVDYSRSKLSELMAKGMLENRFCALTSFNDDRHRIIEFDLGSTDSPVLGWLDKHGLSLELLSQDKKNILK